MSRIAVARWISGLLLAAAERAGRHNHRPDLKHQRYFYVELAFRIHAAQR